MGHRVRWYVTEVVEEVTIRTMGGAFWLRPDAACKAIIEGVFAKASQIRGPGGAAAHTIDRHHATRARRGR